MPRCSCAGNSCSCIIQAGSGLVISGTGNNSAPYTVSLAPNYLLITQAVAGTIDLTDVPSGAIVELNLSANVTGVTLPTTPGLKIEIAAKQVIASRTIVWPTIKWVGGVVPTLSTTINYIDWIVLRRLGTDWIGAVEGAAIR